MVVLSWLLAILRGRMSSFIYSYSYLKTEFSTGKLVRTLLSGERKGLGSGVLQKERKYTCLAGREGGGDGKVVRWRCLGRLEGRWKVGRV